MTKKANVCILIGAALVGALAVNIWDGCVERLQFNLVQKELADQRQAPAVDLHSLGLHGRWSDVHMDEDPPYTADDQAKIAEADAKARPIFSTPGGHYTKEDIALNGTTPPYERLHEFKFLSTMKAGPSQPYDPITKNRTAAAYDWYVGGNLYHFASIASLEAFVMLAKTDPGPLPSPDKLIVPGKPIKEEKA